MKLTATIKRAIYANCIVLFVASCHQARPLALTLPGIDLSGRLLLLNSSWKDVHLVELNQNFSPASLPKGLMWRRGNLALLVSAEQAHLNINKNLVMVSFAPALDFNKKYRTFANALAIDPRVQVYFPGDSEHHGFALVAVNDSQDLTNLAAEAHGESGLPCGQVEVVNLNQTLTTLDTPTSPPYGETIPLSKIKSVIGDVSSSNISTTMKTLQDLGSRQHNTSAGIAASATIKSLMDNAASGLDSYGSALKTHSYYTTQQSVIATLSGSSDNESTIIIGAHLDSINRSDSSQAPGADDDASGIATLVEALRVITKNNMKFARKIEFHAYAAEEIGLVGSKEIASDYRTAGRKIPAMLQIDMNSYSKDSSKNTIYLITNDTSETLTVGTADLLDTYLGGDYQKMSLSAGTSDHKSWSSRGYQAVFPFEHPEDYNHALHTSADTVSTANNTALSERFTKLVIAFLAHHAGLVGAESEYSTALTTIFEKTDMALAIMPATTSGTYTVAAGTTPDIVRVESCLVSGPSETVCLAARTEFSATSLGDDRHLFAGGDSASGISLADGNYLRVMGWSKDNQLLAQRTVVLSSK